MASTLEIVLLSLDWGATAPALPKGRPFVQCHVYDRVTLASQQHRLDLGKPLVIPGAPDKANCFVWMRLMEERKNLVGHLKRIPVVGLDHIGLDLSQPQNLPPNYRVPNDFKAPVNLTIQARWRTTSQSPSTARGAVTPYCMPVSKARLRWQYFHEESSQWIDYSPEFSEGIGRGLESGYRSFKFNDIHFMIEGQTGTHRNKKSGSTRPIRGTSEDGHDNAERQQPPTSAAGASRLQILGPFGIIPYVTIADRLTLDLPHQTYQLAPLADLGPVLGSLTPAQLSGRLGTLTPLPALSGAEAEIRAVQQCIPMSAASSAFLYPLPALAGRKNLDPHDPCHATLTLGGFVYLDAEGRCVALHGLSPAGEGLQFSDRLKVARGSCPTALRATLAPVVYEGFAAVGAHRFAWVPPGATFPALPIQIPRGGLLFEVAEDPEHFTFFAVHDMDPLGTRLKAHSTAPRNGEGGRPLHVTFVPTHLPTDGPPPPTYLEAPDSYV